MLFWRGMAVKQEKRVYAQTQERERMSEKEKKGGRIHFLIAALHTIGFFIPSPPFPFNINMHNHPYNINNMLFYIFIC